MSLNSHIEWTEATWNPVTGCTQVSPGCAHCYAKVFAERFQGVPGHPYEMGFDLTLRPERLRQPLEWKRPKLIFVNSMSDLFHDAVSEEYIRDIFDVMRKAGWHTFQVLTKRSARMTEITSRLSVPENVWLGVSVENQRWTSRIEDLRGISAGVRFLSCEPLLGPLELDLTGINWVIVGGESGHRARRMEPDWVRSIRKQCQRAGVAFFFKQWGAFDEDGIRRGKSAAGRLLDNQTWDGIPGRSQSLKLRTVPSG